MSTNTVTVYTQPSCPACTATKRALDRAGITYQERPITDDDRLRFKTAGLMQAPVIETSTDTWSGYRPDKLQQLKNAG